MTDSAETRNLKKFIFGVGIHGVISPVIIQYRVTPVPPFTWQTKVTSDVQCYDDLSEIS